MMNVLRKGASSLTCLLLHRVLGSQLRLSLLGLEQKTVEALGK